MRQAGTFIPCLHLAPYNLSDKRGVASPAARLDRQAKPTKIKVIQ